jgi:tRNA/rRNA methyltransferase
MLTTMASKLLARIRLVLLRPRNPENLGAIARAMKNFELSTWSLVDPRTHDFRAARRVAVHSEELLDKPRLVGSLDEAIAEAGWVVGTSSRHLSGVRTISSRSFAVEALEQAALGREVALVFGDERSGMSNDELVRCHALAHIPSGAAQPSINLAQALTVFAYELATAAASHAGRPETAIVPAVNDSQLEQLENQLGIALEKSGFLHPEKPRHALRDLMRALQRARLSPREWRLWMAALGKLGKLGGRASKREATSNYPSESEP